MACLDDASSGSSHRRVRSAARAAYRLFSASRSWLTANSDEETRLFSASRSWLRAKRADTMITTGVPIAETRSVHLTPVVVTWTTSNGHSGKEQQVPRPERLEHPRSLGTSSGGVSTLQAMPEEQKKPKPYPHDPHSNAPRLIVSNPSTAGIQPTNRPDGRSMPHGEYERRVARG